MSNRPQGTCCWPASQRLVQIWASRSKSATNPAGSTLWPHTVAAHCAAPNRRVDMENSYYNRGRTGHQNTNSTSNTLFSFIFYHLSITFGLNQKVNCRTLGIQTTRHLLPQKQNMNKPLTVGQTQGQPSLKRIPNLEKMDRDFQLVLWMKATQWKP